VIPPWINLRSSYNLIHGGGGDLSHIFLVVRNYMYIKERYNYYYSELQFFEELIIYIPALILFLSNVPVTHNFKLLDFSKYFAIYGLQTIFFYVIYNHIRSLCIKQTSNA
jgi:hypothetical protein